MKTLLSAIVATALSEMNKPNQEPTVTVNVVEVYYTLLAEGRSEMWTENIRNSTN